MLKNSYIILAVLFAFQNLAHSGQHHPSVQEFFEQVREHWSVLRDEGLEAPDPESVEVGDTVYVPLQVLIRTQEDIAVDNVLAKISEREDAGDMTWHKKRKEWTFNHNHGQSAVSKEEAIEVILGPQGWVVIDGHHDLFLSIYTGAETIAVKVMGKYLNLSPVQFWRKLKSKKDVDLPASSEDLAKRLPVMTQVKDNPNRYLAGLLAMKVKTMGLKIEKVNGSDNPIWIKVNDGVPFMEFYIADVLKKAGIQYDSDWGTEVPKEVVEEARGALIKAKIKGLILFKSAKDAARCIEDPSLLKRLISKNCTASFRSRK